jgi:hypothetical protein
LNREKTVIEKALIGNATDEEEFTSIRISKRTLNYLGKLGRFKQTWNDVIETLAMEKLGLQTPVGEGSY